MELLIEVLKFLGPALIGGGAGYLFNIKAKIRRDANQINEADYDTVSKVIKGATSDLRALADRIGELEKERIKILEEMSVIHDERHKLREEVAELKKMNALLEKSLRAHMMNNNPNLGK